MPALNYGYSDMYPSMGGLSTRIQTVPEAEDQNTLVDDEELAQQNPAQVTNASNKSMMLSVLAVVVVIFVLNIR